MRVGVVGAGTMGSVHAESHREAGHEVVAIFDIRPEAAAGLAAKVGAKVAESVDVLLSDPSIELIDVCVPTYLHRQYVEAAAKAGKHVLCEKPIALTLADAEAMVEACRAARVQFFVAHVVRFFPEYEQAYNQVKAGKIGEPGVVRTSRGGGFPTGWEDWYADSSKSGTLMLDLIIHDFDWLRWTFGEVERVYAKNLEGKAERMDYALVTLRFASGAIAHVEGSWAHPGAFRYGFELAGSEGLVEFDSAKVQPLVVQQRRAVSGRAAGVAVPESPLRESPYTTEIRHFAQCLKQGITPRVTAHDACKALEISLAALESARHGRAVTLPKEEK